MSDSEKEAAAAGGEAREAMHSMLFNQLVVQQSSLALILLGKAPHPETGKTTRDLDAARLFIEQLEMLEAKTRGNLARHEETLLKQTLMTLRLAYVEAAEAAPLPAPESKTAPGN